MHNRTRKKSAPPPVCRLPSFSLLTQFFILERAGKGSHPDEFSIQGALESVKKECYADIANTPLGRVRRQKIVSAIDLNVMVITHRHRNFSPTEN
jgi:hypothetical protein